ncbi:hypothetical protein KP509_28G009900 [Ceratopteris richardii]|uniref:Uncharacterized protein n=1 Tax=Ceratopteris richardii TaxID=49495 RepID=A0A8T2RB18_CERRI|nr:hypothetical protein KP509_28G009900 [Ceratopteris richardii]
MVAMVTDGHKIISCIPGSPPHTLYLLEHSRADGTGSFEGFENTRMDYLVRGSSSSFNVLHEIHSLCSALKDRPGAHECLSWLDSKAEGSVLYVCFGTLFHLQKKEFEEVALGIEESNRSFL